MSIRDALQRVVDGKDLGREEAAQAMTDIMEGAATPAQMAGFLTALRMKGETVEEITGLAQVMRQKAVLVHPAAPDLVDTCGTGGARVKTFNVSTTAAFVLAGAGVAVAKHGNRSATRASGSADVLEALGVNLAVDPERVTKCIDRVGIGFLFAPHFHPAMRYAAPVRKDLGIRTIFNLLGPLTNPAGATVHLMGVFAPEWTEPLARTLGNLGCRRALVVHGEPGIDELSTLGPTRVSELDGGQVHTYQVAPGQLGLPIAQPEQVAGGTPQENAQIAVAVLSGEPGPCRDLVLLNAAAGLMIAGVAKDLEQGLTVAANVVDKGLALHKLEQLRAFTNRT